MDDYRMEELRARLGQETNDPESQEWREDLTPEELEYVEQLDDPYASVVLADFSAFLVLEQVRERFR